MHVCITHAQSLRHQPPFLSAIFRESRHLSIYLSIYPSFYVSIYLSIYLSMYLSIYPSIHLSYNLGVPPRPLPPPEQRKAASGSCSFIIDYIYIYNIDTQSTGIHGLINYCINRHKQFNKRLHCRSCSTVVMRSALHRHPNAPASRLVPNA